MRVDRAVTKLGCTQGRIVGTDKDGWLFVEVTPYKYFASSQGIFCNCFILVLEPELRMMRGFRSLLIPKEISRKVYTRYRKGEASGQ